MRARLAADRLYALSIRPHEWDSLREHAELALRYGPIADDPAAAADRHWTLLVIEARVHPPAGDPMAGQHADGLEVLRAGWEAEWELPIALPASALEEDPDDVPTLLAKIASLVNDCAARAGIEILLPPATVAELVARYRTPAG